MDAATLQALQSWAKGNPQLQSGTLFAKSPLQLAQSPQNTSIYSLNYNGTPYYYVPSDWTAGGGGTASLSADQAATLGGTPFSMPWSPTRQYSTGNDYSGGSMSTAPALINPKGYIFQDNPGGAVAPGASNPNVGYRPGTGGGFAGIDPQNWQEWGMLAAAMAAGLGGAVLGPGQAATGAGEAGAGGVMGSGALGAEVPAGLGGYEIPAGLAASGAGSVAGPGALSAADAGAGAGFGVGAASGSGSAIMPGAEAASAGATGGILPAGATGGGTLAQALAGSGISGAMDWVGAHPLAAGIVGVGALSALSGAKPKNTAAPVAPGQGFIPGSYDIAAPRTYNPYTGDYAHYAEPGGGMGHEFFTPVNNLDTSPLPNAPVAKAKGGPLSMMDEESPAKAPVGALGQASAHLVRGPGGGQDDLIPAQLSDGEYVFDADTVSALGDGSNEEGAKRLDHMRENIRSHKRSAKENKIPPKAKSPLQYFNEGA